jgi:hypothetical protein
VDAQQLQLLEGISEHVENIYNTKNDLAENLGDGSNISEF